MTIPHLHTLPHPPRHSNHQSVPVSGPGATRRPLLAFSSFTSHLANSVSANIPHSWRGVSGAHPLPPKRQSLSGPSQGNNRFPFQMRFRPSRSKIYVCFLFNTCPPQYILSLLRTGHYHNCYTNSTTTLQGPRHIVSSQ